MAEAPLSRIVIMTEDGSTIRPTEMVKIPPFVPSLLTLFENGRQFNSLAPSAVPGLVERFREIDAICKSKGR